MMRVPEGRPRTPSHPPTPRHAHYPSLLDQAGHDVSRQSGGQLREVGEQSPPPERGFGARFAHHVVTDAEAEGVSPSWAWRVFWTPAVGGVLVALTFAVRPVYYWLLREDHLLEWVQFALCLLAAVAALLAAGRFAGRRRWLSAVTLVVMAVGCLGLAGEEISWRQRVIGFAASGVANNRQGEFNLHNIDKQEGVPVEELFRIFELALGLVGTVLPLLTRWRPAVVRNSFLRTFSPPLFLAPGFFAVFGYRAFRLVFPAEISAVVKYQEWAEVCLYGALLIMATLLSVPRPRTGDPGRTTPLRAADLRIVLIAGVFILVLTAVFATLTLMSGVQPGNV